MGAGFQPARSLGRSAVSVSALVRFHLNAPVLTGFHASSELWYSARGSIAGTLVFVVPPQPASASAQSATSVRIIDRALSGKLS